MSSISLAGGRRLRLDPGLVNTRATAVTMATVLASWGSALLLEGWAGLHTDVVVLAVSLSITLNRGQRPGESARHRALGVALLPLIAILASQVGFLMTRHAPIGDALFAVAVSASIWLRRFGGWMARLGTLAAMPFLAMLVTPVPLSHDDARSLWTAVVGLIAIGWVALIRYVAERAGFLPGEPGTAPSAASGAASGAEPGAAARGEARRAPRRSRLSPSARLAAQMGVALGVAFLVGHQVFERHWPWVVITAFIVSSGNRGRGDVIYKAVLRLVGALAGTVVASLLAGTFPPGDRAGIVAIFAALTVGTWLRTYNYAYWAACVTAMLSLLYGYFGESGTEVLGERLLCITVGAAIAVAAAWSITPVRTTDVLRRRVADALAALSDFLTAVRTEPAGLAAHHARYVAGSAQLQQIMRPLRAHRVLTHPWRSGGPHQADVIDGVRRCEPPLTTLTRLAAEFPATLTRPEYARRAGRHARTVGALRLAIAGRGPDPTPEPAPDPARGAARRRGPDPDEPPPPGADEINAAFTELGNALAGLETSIWTTNRPRKRRV
jgi:hypothetical protein